MTRILCHHGNTGEGKGDREARVELNPGAIRKAEQGLMRNGNESRAEEIIISLNHFVIRLYAQ